MPIRLDTSLNGAAIHWLGQSIRLPILASDTGGAFTAQFGSIPVGFINPPHVHTLEDEIFYVIDGCVDLRIADKAVRLDKGDLAFAPAGLPHQVMSRGDSPVKLLVLLTSESIEHAFISSAGKSHKDIDISMTKAGVVILKHFDANFRPTGFESLTSDAVIVRRAAEGEAYWLAGDTYTVKLSGEETKDRFSIIHFDIPPGGGPVPHVHTRDFEAFVITEGEVELYADGEIVTGRPDDVAVLPTNIPHCFKNRTDKQSQMIAIVAPSGFDRFIRLAGRKAVLGQASPPIDEDEKRRLVSISPEFGVTLRTDIHF